MARPLAKTAARGYDARHQALRADYQARMDCGEQFDCWRCGHLIAPGQAWDLGHDDHDRSITHGPEHRHSRHCPKGGNRATAGRKPTQRPTLRTSRNW